jgi:hypothetical protein
VPKYRKKPVVIEAMEYKDDPQVLSDISDFVGDDISIDYGENPPVLEIKTLEGNMKAKPGDFIIKGVNGEFYPCKPDIFEKTYESVD